MSRPHQHIPFDELLAELLWRSERRHTDEILERLNFVNDTLNTLSQNMEKLMAIGDDILAKVTEEDTKVDSVIAFIKALQADGTIPAAVSAAILAKIQGSEDKLDAAIGANTAPPAP